MNLKVQFAFLNIKELFPNQTVSICVEPPSVNELKIRLQKRGSDSNERIAKRLENLKL